MVSLTALVLCVASTIGANDVVLLDFSASWCGPCQKMDPVVRRLETAGYPIRRVDFDREKELVSQLGVTGIPCFILVANNRVVDRVEGATSYERLTQMFTTLQSTPAANPANRFAPSNSSNAPADTSVPIVRGQSPDSPGLGLPGMGKFNSLFNPKRAPPDNGTTDAGKRPADSFAPGATPLAGASSGGASSPTQQALFATVRLRVEDPSGHSLGTGTIVDQHDNEALIVTCGHLFRDSKGKGSIQVDLFGPGAPRTVAGQVIDYDLQRDIGVVAIRVDGPVQVAKVAASGFNVSKGNRVFSIGCDKGNPPTVLTSHVTATNKYIGPPNVEVAGQPVDGRSGGGLFSSDGSLIGVCNAADPADREGIYAALATVHWQLAQVGQQRLFQEEASPTAAPKSRDVTLLETAATGGAAAALTAVRPLVNNIDPARAAATAAAVGQAAMGHDMEVLCIIKSKSDPNGKSRVFVLNNLPPELIERMATEINGPTTVRNANDLSSSGGAMDPRFGNRQQDNGSGPVVRGQSQR